MGYVITQEVLENGMIGNEYRAFFSWEEGERRPECFNYDTATLTTEQLADVIDDLENTGREVAAEMREALAKLVELKD